MANQHICTSGMVKKLAIRWVDTMDDYVHAATSHSLRVIPVLRPDSHHQEQRWRHVLKTLFTQQVHTPEQNKAPLIITWGADSIPMANVYSGQLNASRLHGVTFADVITALRQCTQTSVIVFAYTAQLKVGAVMQLLSAAKAASKRLGFITGRNTPALSFSVAKALLLPAPELLDQDFIDAPGHRLQSDHATAVDLIKQLKQPSAAKIIRSHGEGSHAKLPGLVVCGVLDAFEFPDNPALGCSQQLHRCKRANSTQSQILFGEEVAAPVICFLCCNGFNLASELYPSPVSMALSLTEGYAAAVIAPLRPLTIANNVVDTIRQELAAGNSLGAIIDKLNSMSEKTGQRNCFALIGNPDFSLPPVSGIKPTIPCDKDQNTNDVKLVQLQHWLVQLLKHTERGQQVRRALSAWLGNSQSNIVTALSAKLEQVEQLAMYAIKWAETWPEGDSLDKLIRSTVPVRLLVTQWDKTIAQQLLDARQDIDPFDIGHYSQVLIDVKSGAHCYRCGTPTEIHHYGKGLSEHEQRTALLCCVCGPVSEHRLHGIALLANTNPSVIDRVLRIRVHLYVPDNYSLSVGSVMVYLKFFDKSNDGCIQQSYKVVPAQSQVIEFDIKLPEHSGTDLHSIRLIAASNFDIAYARIRFANLPQPANRACSDTIPEQ